MLPARRGKSKSIDMDPALARFLDGCSPVMALGAGMTRIGCFLSGCWRFGLAHLRADGGPAVLLRLVSSQLWSAAAVAGALVLAYAWRRVRHGSPR
jgi:prolipoprotein diacylglyceryltransferase